MKKKIKSFFNTVSFLFAVYCPGLFFYLNANILRLFGRIKIYCSENIKKIFALKKETGRGILFISNHKSFYLEPFLLPTLIIGIRLFLSPFKEFPYSMPDFKNFSKWWLFFMQSMRLLKVPRHNIKEIKEPKEAMAEYLCVLGCSGIIHPEGGRTVRQKEIIEKNGIEIAKLKMGYLSIIRHGCEKLGGKPPIIVPILFDKTDKVLPYGQSLPNFFTEIIDLVVGEPIVVDYWDDERINPENLLDRLFELKLLI